jgi:hypothetical protein
MPNWLPRVFRALFGWSVVGRFLVIALTFAVLDALIGYFMMGTWHQGLPLGYLESDNRPGEETQRLVLGGLIVDVAVYYGLAVALAWRRRHARRVGDV